MISAATVVEATDLAAKEPARLKELVARWEVYARRANVLPWIWKPAYKGGRDVNDQ
ncbi:MAG: hypothetical protein U0736_27795 [Gemmataceae bacterium]